MFILFIKLTYFWIIAVLYYITLFLYTGRSNNLKMVTSNSYRLNPVEIAIYGNNGRLPLFTVYVYKIFCPSVFLNVSCVLLELFPVKWGARVMLIMNDWHLSYDYIRSPKVDSCHCDGLQLALPPAPRTADPLWCSHSLIQKSVRLRDSLCRRCQEHAGQMLKWEISHFHMKYRLSFIVVIH